MASRIRHIQYSSPAAGADLLQVVPAGFAWRVIGCTFVLITSATVSNRSFQLVFLTDGGLRVEMTGANVDHPASTDKSYIGGSGIGYCGVGCKTIAGAEKMIMPIANRLWLLPGWVLGTAIGNLQVGDQLSQPHFTIEERSCNSNGVIRPNYDL